MKKNILAILVAAAGAWTVWADYGIRLKYDAVPAHVTLTFSGRLQDDFTVSVAGAAEAATLSQISYATTGWTITATPDVGYETPTFSTCFYDDSNGDYPETAQSHVGSATITDYDVHVYNIAVSPKQVEVKFDSGIGRLPDGTPTSRIVSYDSAYGALPEPTCEGYLFDGWFTEFTGGTQVTESDKMTEVVSTQRLYAHWTPITYTVVFNANGGSGTMAPMTLTYDQWEDLTSNAFTRAHYKFDRWMMAGGRTGPSDGESVRCLASAEGAVVTLFAQWTPDEHTISCDLGDGVTNNIPSQPFGSLVNVQEPTRDGYTFSGWSPALPEKMPPTNLFVKASWKVNAYTITYNTNDGLYVQTNLLYGATVEAPDDPVQAGSVFKGWTPALPPTMPASNLTVTAQWEQQGQGDVTVTFSVPDGVVTTNGLAESSEAPSNVVASPDGHTLSADYPRGRRFGWLPGASYPQNKKTFQTWRFQQDGVWQTITADTLVQASSLTNLVVKWEGDLHAEALDVTNLEVTASNAWKPVSNDAAAGGSCLCLSNFNVNVKADVTVRVAGPGKLTYNWKFVSPLAIGGSTWNWGNVHERIGCYTNYTDESTKVYGLVATDGQLLELEGVALTGSPVDWEPHWLTNEIVFTEAGVTNTVMWRFTTDGDHGGMAWLDNVRWDGEGTIEPLPTYTVTFNKNGEDAVGDMSPATVDENGKPLPANAFSRAGFGFAGWNTQPDGTGLAVADGATLAAAADVTLYAQWYAGMSTISFDMGDGVTNTVTQTSGTQVVLPFATPPSRSGYVFTGWSPALPSTMPASDLTVTAQWAEESYWIVFDTAGGSEVEAVNLKLGAAVVSPANPVQEGCTFDGWSPALPLTMPASNLWVTAQWTTNSYVITFDTDGGSVVQPMTCKCWSVVTPPEDPARTGYVFGGWTPALPDVMPARDLAVTAQWRAIAYTITFDSAGGSSVAPIVQRCGTAVTAPADPVRPGYVFAGWTPALPETMPASDLTVTATWKSQTDPTNTETNAEWHAEGILYSHITSDKVDAAMTYDGCLYDAQGRVAGIVQVKRGKYNAQKDLAKITATVTLAGKKKLSYTGGAWHSGSDQVKLTSTKDSRVLKVVLGARGLAGTYGNEYVVDGAANLFTSKNARDKNDSAAVLNGIKAVGGAYVIAVPSDVGWGGLTLAVKSRGKVSVTGTLAGGKKVNVSSQLLIGEASCCIPVVSSKFAEPAFVVWLARDGGSAEVVGLDGAKLAAVKSSLAAGATFKVDEAALMAMLGSSLRTDYLPNGFSVTAAGTKWLVENGAKAGQVKMDRQTGELTTTSENWAALKLTYKAKTGQFSGSFKAYTQAAGKLKTATVKVAGVLVDGTGYGMATVKKQSATVKVAPENN